MYENIIKTFESAKGNAVMWYNNATNYDTSETSKLHDAMESLFYIGRAFILAQILKHEYHEDELQTEMNQLEKMKEHLQYEVIPGLKGGV